MRDTTVEMLRCPNGCSDTLKLNATERRDGRIVQGELNCSGCGKRYPIVGGIARMLPGGETLEAQDARETERKQSEMAARDAQVEDYDKMRGLALFSKIEIPVTLSLMKLRESDVLLEAGCGTGRMTPTFAARCKSHLAVDFSYESLRVCQKKVMASGRGNVDFVQADVCALPFQSNLFSNVVSCQVLEHIPTPESRARMVAELARTAQTGASVVLSAYQHSLLTRLFGQKEGEHEGGIYYYRFARQELRDLLATSLDVQGMTGALVYHYLARCSKKAH